MALSAEPAMFEFEHGDPKDTAESNTNIGHNPGEAFVARELSATSSAATCIPSDLNQPIELSRRAVPVVEAEADVCSICLDCFTTDDPSAETVCGHEYHLQCIMQWAQRSRECPMCFRALHLQDEDLNELLPFGEYVPPEHVGSPHMLHGLENYELERLLASLALRNRGGGGGRRNRAQRQSARLAIRSNLASGSSPNIAPAGTTDSLDAHMAASAVAREQRDSGASGAGPAGTPESRSGLGGGRARDAFPASWPPAGTLHMQYEDDGASDASPSTRQHHGVGDLKSRLAALSSRAKESFSKTSKEIKTLWGRPGSYGDPGTSAH